MARSTCNPNVAVPKGMMRFEVIRTTIRDSLGQFCVPGDMAVLSRDEAQVYLDQNHIRVALPDFDDATATDSTNEDPNPSEKSGEGSAERSEAEDDTGPSRRQRGGRDTANT